MRILINQPDPKLIFAIRDPINLITDTIPFAIFEMMNKAPLPTGDMISFSKYRIVNGFS